MRHEPEIKSEDRLAEIRDRVAQVLASRGDIDAFLSFFHEDAVFHMTGSVPSFPFAGVYAGKGAIRTMIERIDVEVEHTGMKILHLLIEDNKLALLRSVSLRHRGTAARTDLIVSNFVTFEDLKAVEIQEHFDTLSYASLASDD
ncbi:ketosteroid isomerase-like protein [Rhodoblastus acidophilus]|uniref:nuclear transport factor 2 family protein n=1 Tax=Rhodoblastus acidophilus TaxID=1074 RepID=UPI00222455C3|nr:nuclear transport factor 2 family protein [Rhodoblastus acidophilus]MCW2283469.1 ketosteroid isomerase-like protein [Rhodoblastus acidophilus]MCW2332207.1 ketosteroid isomerase-like protein [Rhodoblastus acidophilus]